MSLSKGRSIASKLRLIEKTVFSKSSLTGLKEGDVVERGSKGEVFLFVLGQDEEKNRYKGFNEETLFDILTRVLETFTKGSEVLTIGFKTWAGGMSAVTRETSAKGHMSFDAFHVGYEGFGK